jgi:hypothetical protein
LIDGTEVMSAVRSIYLVMCALISSAVAQKEAAAAGLGLVEPE